MVDILDFISSKRHFNRRQFVDALELDEETCRRWLEALEDRNLVRKWRRYGNEPYTYEALFKIQRERSGVLSERGKSTSRGGLRD